MTQVTKELVKEATKSGNGNGKNEVKTVKKESAKPEIKTVQKAVDEKKTETKVVPISKGQDDKIKLEQQRFKELEDKLEKAEKLNAEMQVKLQPKKLSFQEMQDEIENIVNNGKLLEKLVTKKDSFKRRFFEVKEFVFGTGIGNGSLLLRDANNKDLQTTETRFLKVAHQAILSEASIMLDEIEEEIKGFMQKIA